MQRVVGAVVVLGMICLCTWLNDRMIRVHPPGFDSLSVALSDTFSTSPVKSAPLARAPVSPPASFLADPLRFLSFAPLDSLDLLPGIGPVLAGRIIESRRAHGGFDSWDRVLEVKGIGPRMIARWRALSRK